MIFNPKKATRTPLFLQKFSGIRIKWAYSNDCINNNTLIIHFFYFFLKLFEYLTTIFGFGYYTIIIISNFYLRTRILVIPLVFGSRLQKIRMTIGFLCIIYKSLAHI